MLTLVFNHANRDVSWADRMSVQTDIVEICNGAIRFGTPQNIFRFLRCTNNDIALPRDTAQKIMPRFQKKTEHPQEGKTYHEIHP